MEALRGDLKDMEASAPAVEMALRNKGPDRLASKTAHFPGPEWTPVEQSLWKRAPSAKIPVMVDFGNDHPERPLAGDLLTKKLRPWRYLHANTVIPACVTRSTNPANSIRE